MYLYILALHSGSRRGFGAGAQEWLMNDTRVPSVSSRNEGIGTAPDAINRVSVSYLNSHDLRGDPPLGQPSRARTETEALGVRLWYSKQAVDPAALEKVLADAYAFGFGKHSQLEDRAGTVLEQRTWGGRPNSSVSVYMKSEYKFCVTRIELPEGMEESGAEEDLLPFWDASGTPLTLRPREIQMYSDDMPTVSIPYVPPPKEFRTLEDIQRFANYVGSMNAMEKAKASWRGEMFSDDNIVGKEDEFGCAYPMENFGDSAAFQPLNVFKREKDETHVASLSRNRILIVKPVGLAQAPTRALMPCDATPWLGTDLLPEFEVQAVAWDPSVGFLEEATLSALAAKFKPATAAPVIPGSVAVKVPERAEPKPVAPAPKFPHQEDLDVLWEVFTREYIQRPKRAGGLDHVRIPKSILVAVWKMLALHPKSANIFGNPQYENSILRKKDTPKNWSKVITPEILTEYFYAKDEKFQGCILYTFYNRGFLQTLLDFYDLKMAVNDNINWLAFPAIDPAPVVLALTNPTGLTDDHKKGWVAKFVRERLDKKEKAVAGSQETYSDFISWVNTGLFVSQSIKYSSQHFSEFLAQFPQPEFTRLMKESGIPMTRRARGMVFVGVSLHAKADDDWTVESGERAPTEGEILPGPTGAAEVAAEGDGVTGVDAIADAEGSWAAP